MKFYQFNPTQAKVIDRFSSSGVRISPFIRQEGFQQTACIHFEKEGCLGMHPATVNQLFIVVSGEGWVRVKDSEKVKVSAGIAVYWEPGEEHESGSEESMEVIVLEGANIDPSTFMAEIEVK
ncbi:cupin domain-containing protein [Alkalihalobacillus sp. TS-13]|uniref:cupin domain-containing protein n=1 Tax=Alkalihalobacillus sp. TS-13 TaxID=2842455 RepID=UPI001C86DF5A|nr:cupin domain-containing protein [Alkalihalobacillus sp. TS-13]